MSLNSAPFNSLLEAVIDNRGKTCPTADKGLPLIATNCVKSSNLYPTYEKVRFVSEETYENWFRGHPLPNDMLFVTKGSPGEVCWVPDPVDFCIAQDMVAIRPDPTKVYPKYLFAALRSSQIKHSIENMHVGTMIPHFKKGDFDKLAIPLPDRTTQLAIGDLYFSLCEKIELNRRMNETLEAMARALFKDWFVDFGPTRAKIEGREPYLAPHLWDLFPDTLDDDGKPEGWEALSFEQLVTAKQGKYIAKAQMKELPSEESPVPVWGGNGIRGYVSDSIYNEPVIWITCRGSNCGLIGYTESSAWISNNAFGCSPKIGSVYAAYIALLAENFGDTISGSAQPQITYTSLRTKPLGFAINRTAWNEFSKLIEAKFDRLLRNSRESSILAKTRDLLLPKLMSGEIRLCNAEKQMEAVA